MNELLSKQEPQAVLEKEEYEETSKMRMSPFSRSEYRCGECPPRASRQRDYVRVETQAWPSFVGPPHESQISRLTPFTDPLHPVLMNRDLRSRFEPVARPSPIKSYEPDLPVFCRGFRETRKRLDGRC
jgi:hypothetical protein